MANLRFCYHIVNGYGRFKFNIKHNYLVNLNCVRCVWNESERKYSFQPFVVFQLQERAVVFRFGWWEHKQVQYNVLVRVHCASRILYFNRYLWIFRCCNSTHQRNVCTCTTPDRHGCFIFSISCSLMPKFPCYFHLLFFSVSLFYCFIFVVVALFC